MAVIPVSLRVPIRGRNFAHHWPAEFNTETGDIIATEDDDVEAESVPKVDEDDDNLKRIVMPSGTMVPVDYDPNKNAYYIRAEPL